MISSSSPSPSPRIYSQHSSPRNNVWNRPTHPRSSSFSVVGAATSSGGRASTLTTSSEMRPIYSRSPRPAPSQSPVPAREMRNASTQWSSPETPELERSSVSGKRKARAREDVEAPSEASSPPRPRLTPRTHAATPGQQKSGGPSPQPTGNQQAVASKPPESSTITTIQSSSSQPQSSRTTDDSPTTKRPRPETPSIKIVPLNYEDCPSSDLVPIISSMLMELIRHNDTPVTNTGLTRFHSRAPPGISVQDYLQRLAHHATLSPPILLCMVYYIDRLCAVWPKFTINSLTVHRYLIASATVASKGLSDSFWTNATYARVGGVSLKELALLELEFLWRIEWRIVPKPEVLVDYYKSLVQRCEGFEIASQPEREAEVARALDTGDMNVDA